MDTFRGGAFGPRLVPPPPSYPALFALGDLVHWTGRLGELDLSLHLLCRFSFTLLFNDHTLDKSDLNEAPL